MSSAAVDLQLSQQPPPRPLSNGVGKRAESHGSTERNSRGGTRKFSRSNVFVSVSLKTNKPKKIKNPQRRWKVMTQTRGTGGHGAALDGSSSYPQTPTRIHARRPGWDSPGVLLLLLSVPSMSECRQKARVRGAGWVLGRTARPFGLSGATARLHQRVSAGLTMQRPSVIACYTHGGLTVVDVQRR